MRDTPFFYDFISFFFKFERVYLVRQTNVTMVSSQSACNDANDCGCECHKINWLKIIEKGDYEMVDGSPVQMGA